MALEPLIRRLEEVNKTDGAEEGKLLHPQIAQMQ